MRDGSRWKGSMGLGEGQGKEETNALQAVDRADRTQGEGKAQAPEPRDESQTWLLAVEVLQTALHHVQPCFPCRSQRASQSPHSILPEAKINVPNKDEDSV